MALPIFQRTVVNDNGDVIPSAQVEVRLESSGALATVYSDRDGVTPLSNPFFADGNGLARFYANPDEYKITASGNGQAIEWRYVVVIDTNDISVVADNQSALQSVAANITDVQNAADNAISAAASAANAANSAGDAATSAASVNAANIVHAPSTGLPNEAGTAYALNIEQLLAKGLFKKTNPSIPAFTKTGNFAVSTSQVFYAEVGGLILTIGSGVVVSMPTATVGKDYAIWLKTDGTLQATDNFVTPPATNARKIGGFHYAPGGNATGQSGGNSTAQINEFSIYDNNYRPACADPRGMTCVAGTFWSDIYLLNNNPDVNGTSSYGKPIADGSTPPIIPAALGGNGSTNYGGLTWFEAMSIAAVYGKSAFTQSEFIAATFGVTEATSRGSDPVNTGLDAPRTSRWGVMQATGNLWTWVADRGGPFAAASWNANTEGFGSEYNAPNASRLGAYWLHGSNAGSRSSTWNYSASNSNPNLSLRLRADHLQLD